MSFQGLRNQPGPLWKLAIFTSTLNDLWICFGAEDNSENLEKYLAKIWGGGVYIKMFTSHQSHTHFPNRRGSDIQV